MTGVSTSSAIAVSIATCFYPVRSKEEGEIIVEMVMRVLNVITPLRPHQRVICNTLLSMVGKREDMECEFKERRHEAFIYQSLSYHGKDLQGKQVS